MINRPFYLSKLSSTIRRAPITVLLGPCQCGKTTLARLFAVDKQAAYFDLESAPELCQLEKPEQVLGDLEGLVRLLLKAGLRE